MIAKMQMKTVWQQCRWVSRLSKVSTSPSEHTHNSVVMSVQLDTFCGGLSWSLDFVILNVGSFYFVFIEIFPVFFTIEHWKYSAEQILCRFSKFIKMVRVLVAVKRVIDYAVKVRYRSTVNITKSRQKKWRTNDEIFIINWICYTTWRQTQYHCDC